MYADSPDTSLLQEALLWAVYGVKIFPCWPETKTPASKFGFKDATTDPTQIKKWFGGGKFLIGAATEGFVVVDLDKHHESVDGVENWKEVVAEHAPDDSWKHTYVVRTPSGGIHIWYRDTNGPDNYRRNTAARVAPGIDTRAQGGYAILPPSCTPSGCYTPIWSGYGIAYLPDWIAPLIDKPDPIPTGEKPVIEVSGSSKERYVAKALKGEIDTLSKAAPGTRNHTLNRCAFSLGTLVGAGMLEWATAHEALMDTAISIGLGEWEAERTIESGLRAGENNPRRVEDRKVRTNV